MLFKVNQLLSGRVSASRHFYWGGAVLCLVLGLMLWAESVPERWEWIGVTPVATIFVDISAVLAAGQAHSAGIYPFEVPNRFDFYGRPHVYGPGWFITGELGLSVVDTFWVGCTLVMCFVTVMIGLFLPSDKAGGALTLLLLISPPVMIALNRANNDLIMVLLLLVAAWLAGRPERIASWAVCIVLGVAALLKFYPVVLGIVLVTQPGGWRRHVGMICSWSLTLSLIVVLQWSSFVSALHLVPVGKSIFVYQFINALELLRDIFLKLPLTTWAGALVGIIAMVVMIWRGRRGWSDFLPTTGQWAMITVGCATVWSACLFAGPNFNYRFIWLLPLAAFAWRRKDANGAEVGSLLIIVLILSWSWWPKHILANMVQAGDHGAGWMLMNAVGFEQACLLGSLVVCLWMLTGWGMRRLRELTRVAAPLQPTEIN